MSETLKELTQDRQCDLLVRAYANEILREKSKIQAINHCQNNIELDTSHNWRQFMYKVKQYITVHG